MQRPTVVTVPDDDTVIDLDVASEPIHDANLASTLRRLAEPETPPTPRRGRRLAPDWAVYGLD